MPNNNLDPLVEQLFNLGAHLGHKASKTHPRSKKYIYQFLNGEAIINLEESAKQINSAKKFIYQLGKEQKQLLIVGTKNQAKEIIKKNCSNNNIFFITNKWIGGFLTNFEEISKNLEILKLLEKEREDGLWNNLPKHEKLKLEKKIKKLRSIYEGITNISKIPDAFFIIDIVKEKGAIFEAKKRKIPTIAIVDTNANPDLVDYPIMANDDLPSVIEFILKIVLESYQQGSLSLK